MAKEIVKVSNDRISQVSSNMMSVVDEIDDYITKINSTLSNVSNAWEGKDANVFVLGLEDIYISELRKLKETIKEYADYLNKIPDKYLNIDSEGANTFGSIEV